MENFVRKIRERRSRRRWGVESDYHVQVPTEWAEKMLANGYSHVQVREGRAARVLVVTALREEDVAEWRKQVRRLKNRERYQNRHLA